MKIKEQEIIDYLKTQEKELKSNDMIKVYRHISPSKAPFLTKFFLDNGLDPLKYLTIVPPAYAYRIQGYYEDKLNIPNNIEVIDWQAFCDINAKEIYIPSSVTYIRGEAFSIIDLKEVYIDGCPKIHEDAFYDCIFIKNIKINCSEEEWYKQNPDRVEGRENWPKVFRHAPSSAKLEFLK